MANDLLEQAPFLSVAPPPESIIDYSQKLTDSAKAALEAQCHSLGYQAKVVILPSDFSPGSMANFDHFCRELAVQWHTDGNRFLLIIDMKAHNVRGLCGKALEAHGVKSDYISMVVLKGEFVSHMKAGDLEGAIRSALEKVQAKVVSQPVAPVPGTEVRTTSPAYTPPPAHGADSLGGLAGFCFVQIVIVFALIAGYFIFGNNPERKARRIYTTLESRLTELYERAGALSQASEYLDTTANIELAKEVSDFFNRLAVLSTAQGELERLKGCNKLSCALSDMRRTAKMSEMLLIEVSTLEPKISTATGASLEQESDDVKNKFLHDANEALEKEDKDIEQKQQAAQIQIDRDKRFRRPVWAYEPVYYQGAMTSDPWHGVREYTVEMNQTQTGNTQLAIAQGLNEQQSYYQWMQDNRDERVRAGGAGNRTDSTNTKTYVSQQNQSSPSSDTSSWGGGSSGDSGGGGGSDFSGGDGGASW